MMSKRFSLYIICVGFAALFAFGLVSEAQAGTLANPTITPTTVYGGRTTTYTVSFEVASSTEIEAQIKLDFPSGFNLPSTMASSSLSASSSGSSIVATSTVSGQVATIWLADGSVTPVGETIQISGIPNIQSPYAGGSYTMHIQTNTQAGVISDSASSTAFSITASPKSTVEGSTTTYSDTTAPTSFITTPGSAVTISAGEEYIIKGISNDAGGSSVSKVEVSVDGGATWATAEREGAYSYAGSYKWKYVWQNPTEGDYTVKVRATDTENNKEEPGAGVKVTVTGGAISSTPTPTPTPQSGETGTVAALQTQIATLQQTVLGLLQQLVQMLTAQLP